MGTQMEIEPITRQLPVKQNTPMDLLAIALQKEANIDVIERLAALQEKAIKWDAEIQFNEAMNSAQSEIGRIAPDLQNTQTKSKYASYAALDRVIRPIYVRHGFSLSFDTADSPKPDSVRAVCYVSHRAGHTRRYQADVAADGKGPQGAAVMTKTHAGGAAMSYGQRYLLKFIFNIAIGEDDTDGNGDGGMNDVAEKEEWIRNARNAEEVEKLFKPAYRTAYDLGDKIALSRLEKAREMRMKELRGGR